MSGAAQATDFAPSERAPEETLWAEVRVMSQMALLTMLLDAVPDLAVILNQQRQIVFANQACANALGIEDRKDAYGLRPGEALRCIHAQEHRGGCGTSKFCGECGAVRVVLSGLQGNKEVAECRITRQEDMDALDLRVAATPFASDDGGFTVFVVQDISHEKRREVLERAFFHDLGNILTALSGCVEHMSLRSPMVEIELTRMMSSCVDRLFDEVSSQRELVDAENGELVVHCRPIQSLGLLRDLAALNWHGQRTPDNRIRIREDAEDVTLVSDEALLSRIICNMVKNALEATAASGEVVMGCGPTDDGLSVRFWVSNPQSMTEAVQLQVFRRSFSTKGRGRGIGTYSMKLLCERYLKGKVSFTSSPEHGTTFEAVVPKSLDGAATD